MIYKLYKDAILCCSRSRGSSGGRSAHGICSSIHSYMYMYIGGGEAGRCCNRGLRGLAN